MSAMQAAVQQNIVAAVVHAQATSFSRHRVSAVPRAILQTRTHWRLRLPAFHAPYHPQKLSVPLAPHPLVRGARNVTLFSPPFQPLTRHTLTLTLAPP